jgi:hypothetical protein
LAKFGLLIIFTLLPSVTMQTITLQISTEAAEKMLPFLESQRSELLSDLKAVEQQISTIKAKLIAVSNTPPVQQTTFPPSILASAAANSAGKRAKKGESEKIITNFLTAINGSGATLNDVVVGTHTKASTAYRILQRMKDAKRVTLKGSHWTLAS